MCYYKNGSECEMKTKDELPVGPVATAVSLIGGKWNLNITLEELNYDVHSKTNR